VGLFIYRQQSQLARYKLPLPLLPLTQTHPLRPNFLNYITSSIPKSSLQPHSLQTRPFVTTCIQTKSQEAFAMDDFDDSFDQSFNNASDAFSPENQVKKTVAKKPTTAKPAAVKKATTSAPKKTTVPKSDKPKAPAKPRAKKAKIVETLDDEMSFDMDRSFSVLETPQDTSEGPSPPRPAVLQENNAGGKGKNASETYQKVFNTLLWETYTNVCSLLNLNMFLFVLILYDLFMCVVNFCSTLVLRKLKINKCGFMTLRRKSWFGSINSYFIERLISGM